MRVLNKYRVPVKQWRRWSYEAKQVFNRVYNFVVDNQPLMLHPKATTNTPNHWRTTAWNAAWIAADAVDDTIPDYVVDAE